MKRTFAISFLALVGYFGGGSLGCSGGGSSTGTAGTTGTGAAGTSATGAAGTSATGAAGTSATGAAGTSAATGAAGTTATGAAGTGAAGTAAAGTNGAAGTGAAGTGVAGTGAGGTGAGGAAAMTFFVTSDRSMTGNLGGLMGADKRCQDLAAAAGAGSHTWHAYLSTTTVNAKDRIGAGPWRNSKGALLANSVADLHAATKKGDYMLFIDEKGMPIPGQWPGSPAGVQHDILTGSLPDGTLSTGKNCKDWTSMGTAAATGDVAVVGHSDGLGPNGATTGTYTSWNSSHDNMNCADTAPRGGAGRLYCFAIN